MDIKGKAALVTGGAQGIGKGIAKQLAKAGAGVVIADIAFEKAKETEEELQAEGLDVRAVRMDVSKVSEIAGTFDRVVESQGPIDILVNNAGSITLNAALDLSEKEWDLVMDVNAKAVFFLSQAAAKLMIRNNIKGRIVNIASIGGKIPFDNQVHYCASKSAVLGITRVLAVEWAKYGITVNSICPGAVNGDVLIKSYKWVASKTGRKPEDVLNEWLSPVPLGRLIQPEEIGDVVVFLCSEQARTITGQSINVDGGRIFQ